MAIGSNSGLGVSGAGLSTILSSALPCLTFSAPGNINGALLTSNSLFSGAKS